MDRLSNPNNQTERKLLRIEELEERIAPVLLGDNGVDPPVWVYGTQDGTNPADLGAVNAYIDNADTYWIMYVGDGTAEILNTDGGQDLDGYHIGNIIITGSSMNSALLVMDSPFNDGQQSQEDILWPVNAGTLQVNGTITITGDMGYLAIDGRFGDGIPYVEDPVGDGDPDDFVYTYDALTITGTLGKFDVGMLNADVIADGDIYEVDVDSSIGAYYDFDTALYGKSEIAVTIAAAGNIGAIRAGVGLTDEGAATNTTGLIGGVINGSTYIRANSDNMGDFGIIDLIEVRSGTNGGGSLGDGVGDYLPRISAGWGGNVRFIHIDGSAYGFAGGGQVINPIVVDSTSPSIERTIVDDSGGVMILSPVDVEFTDADGAVITYTSSVEYLVIPVDRATQGPGSVVARLVVDGSLNVSVTGNAEIGDVQINGTTSYSEGLAADWLELGVGSLEEVENLTFRTLLDMTGYARIHIGGTGESDVYLVSASGEIPIFINSTPDGDIANINASGDVIYIAADIVTDGDIGATESISPYLLKGPMVHVDGDVAWVDIAAGDADDSELWAIEGSYTRYNSIYGAYIGGNLYGMRAGGAIGDIRLPDGSIIGRVQADANHQRLWNMGDEESPLVNPAVFFTATDSLDDRLTTFVGEVSFFGKITNTVGDGIFGQVYSGISSAGEIPDSLRGDEDGVTGGGYFHYIDVGEGLQATRFSAVNAAPDGNSQEALGLGLFAASGIYTGGYIETVYVSGVGNGIYGDILAEESSPNPDTPYNIVMVRAANGAVIDGRSGFNGWVLIDAGHVDNRFGSLASDPDDPSTSMGVATGVVGTVSVSGAGGVLRSAWIAGTGVHRVVTSGGTSGMVDSHVGAISQGGIESISIDGPGISGSSISANGAGGSIITTGRDGIIEDTTIEMLSGLKYLGTKGLDGDTISIITLGGVSRVDYIRDTTFVAGGIRTINVKYDISDSLIRVSGPLNSVTVGTNIVDSSIQAVGFYGNIGTISVRGSVTGSSIFSVGSISRMTVRGDMDADVTAWGTEGRLTASVYGDVTGTWEIGHELRSLTTRRGGSIAADITAGSIGTIRSGAEISGDIMTGGNARTIYAIGHISGDVTVAGSLGTLYSRTGSILGDVYVAGDVRTIRAAADIGNDATSTVVVDGSLRSMSTGSRGVAGEVKASVTVAESLGSLRATGRITGDVTVGSASRIYAGADIAGDINVTNDARSISAVQDITGLVTVGGDLGTLGTGREGSILGNVVVTGDARSVRAGGDIGVNAASTFNAGTLGSMRAGGEIVAGINVTGQASRIYAVDDISGDLTALSFGTVSSREEITGDVTTTGDLITGGARTISGSQGISGDVTVAGTLRSLYSSYGSITGLVDVNGDLRSVRAGGTIGAGAFTTFNVGGDLGTLRSTGSFSGSLTVDGDAIGILIGGQQAGDVGEVFFIGGSLRTLKVGFAVDNGDLLSHVTVTEDLLTTYITGDLIGNLSISGYARSITVDRIYSDISIVSAEDLVTTIRTDGSIFHEIGDGSYEIETPPSGITGSLTMVDGDVIIYAATA